MVHFVLSVLVFYIFCSFTRNRFFWALCYFFSVLHLLSVFLALCFVCVRVLLGLYEYLLVVSVFAFHMSPSAFVVHCGWVWLLCCDVSD